MVSNFTIAICNEQVVVTDTSVYGTETSDFLYNNTVTIDILESTKINTTSMLYAIDKHDLEYSQNTFDMKQDGLYKVSHIIIPTATWLAHNTVESTEYDYAYYFDNEVIYKWNNITSVWVAFDSIDEAVTELVAVNMNLTLNMLVSYKNTFNLANLNKCFLNVCNEILTKGIRGCTKSVDQDIIWKRDFIWMSLNVMKYYLDLGKIYEAQRTLENIQYCGGICESITINTNNCGCNR